MVAVALAACGNTKDAATAAETATTATAMDAGTVEELPLPTVPESLRQPAERAAYILGHFWDGMVWADTVRSLDTDFMEQNMVNFINLFQYVDTASVRSAVSTMLGGAAKEPVAYAKVMEVADKYLYDPNSPMLDEEYYRIFLAEALGSNVLPDAEMTRCRFKMEEIDRNRRGTKGADFDYIDTVGRRGSLYRFGTDGAMKLVIFYDPECENCAEIIDWLSTDRRVRDLVDGKRLAILGIYPDGDMDEWDKARRKLPDWWTNGYSPEGHIVESETYYLRATPTIYLFAPDNIVVGKDLTAPQLDAWLSGVVD